jgi:hypothetical protein
LRYMLSVLQKHSSTATKQLSFIQFSVDFLQSNQWLARFQWARNGPTKTPLKRRWNMKMEFYDPRYGLLFCIDLRGTTSSCPKHSDHRWTHPAPPTSLALHTALYSNATAKTSSTECLLISADYNHS